MATHWTFTEYVSPLGEARCRSIVLGVTGCLLLLELAAYLIPWHIARSPDASAIGAHALRIQSRSFPISIGHQRVLMFGSSATRGSGTLNEADTLPSQLQAKLEHHDFVNAAQDGGSSWKVQRLIIRSWINEPYRFDCALLEILPASMVKRPQNEPADARRYLYELPLTPKTLADWTGEERHGVLSFPTQTEASATMLMNDLSVLWRNRSQWKASHLGTAPFKTAWVRLLNHDPIARSMANHEDPMRPKDHAPADHRLKGVERLQLAENQLHDLKLAVGELRSGFPLARIILWVAPNYWPGFYGKLEELTGFRSQLHSALEEVASKHGCVLVDMEYPEPLLTTPEHFTTFNVHTTPEGTSKVAEALSDWIGKSEIPKKVPDGTSIQ